ncbi:rCG61949 [Rattus norvegicus]|uniref:RCG61949 n=1 Tax=Rattus norvegicus TaxID=10116 RepID=A6H9G5_RAT|nr:rCG61949 [Rattus norvegicus]
MIAKAALLLLPLLPLHLPLLLLALLLFLLFYSIPRTNRNQDTQPHTHTHTHTHKSIHTPTPAKNIFKKNKTHVAALCFTVPPTTTTATPKDRDANRQSQTLMLRAESIKEVTIVYFLGQARLLLLVPTDPAPHLHDDLFVSGKIFSLV